MNYQPTTESVTSKHWRKLDINRIQARLRPVFFLHMTRFKKVQKYFFVIFNVLCLQRFVFPTFFDFDQALSLAWRFF